MDRTGAGRFGPSWIASTAALLADLADGLGRQTEPFEKRLMRLRVPLINSPMMIMWVPSV